MGNVQYYTSMTMLMVQYIDMFRKVKFSTQTFYYPTDAQYIICGYN